MPDYEEAVEAHQRRVFSFACYWLGDREEAADVTQDVLLRLWHHWNRLRAETLKSWLIRTTRNACIDVLRRRRLQRAAFPRSPLDEDLDAAEQPRGSDSDPRRRLENRELRDELLAAIGELNESHRAVVILREIQGYTYLEISEALDLPVNTVKVYLHRGRRALRERLRRSYAATLT